MRPNRRAAAHPLLARTVAFAWPGIAGAWTKQGVSIPTNDGVELAPTSSRSRASCRASSTPCSRTTLAVTAPPAYYQVRFAIPAIDQQSFCALLPAVGLPKWFSETVGGFAVLSNIAKVTFKK
jgi:hypothetical protein